MCAKVFRLSEERRKDEEYETFLWEIQVWIAKKARVFRDEAMQLAMMKAWKKWDEEQPTGAILEFTDDMFLECADKNVVKLMEMIHAMEEFAGDVKEESSETRTPDSAIPTSSGLDEQTFNDSAKQDRRPELAVMTAFAYSEIEHSFWVLCPRKEFEAKVIENIFKHQRVLIERAKDYYNTSYTEDGFSTFGEFRDSYSLIVSKASGRVSLVQPDFMYFTVSYETDYRSIIPIKLETLFDLNSSEVTYL